MPSIDRPLSGDVLVFDLEEEKDEAADREILERSGRNARTLLKAGPLRVTLVVLAPGGGIPEHSAAGPITGQPVRGTIRFMVGGETHVLGPGEMLSAGAGVSHGVATEDGASILLTMVQPGGEAAGRRRAGG